MTANELQPFIRYIYFKWPYKCYVECSGLTLNYCSFKIIGRVHCFDPNEDKVMSDTFTLNEKDIYTCIFEPYDVINNINDIMI